MIGTLRLRDSLNYHYLQIANTIIVVNYMTYQCGRFCLLLKLGKMQFHGQLMLENNQSLLNNAIDNILEIKDKL